jgi:hypothetical protein
MTVITTVGPICSKLGDSLLQHPDGPLQGVPTFLLSPGFAENSLDLRTRFS